MRNRLWSALALVLHALEAARRNGTGYAAASQSGIVSSPPPPRRAAAFLTVRAEIASSLGEDGLVERGRDVALSCLVTFPQMFALYEPYVMRWYRRRRRRPNASASPKRSANEEAPYSQADGVPATTGPATEADVLSSNGRLQADGSKYRLCYRRPHRFGFVLNYTLIIRGFSRSDEGEYECEGVDNPDDPTWTLNARVSTQPLRLLLANEELEQQKPPHSRAAADSTKASNASSCTTAAGFTYQILSTNCIYYSETNNKSGFAVLLPCPIGTTFDLTKCRCNEGAVCTHG